MRVRPFALLSGLTGPGLKDVGHRLHDARSEEQTYSLSKVTVPGEDRAQHPWARVDWTILVLLFVAALCLRGVGLNQPVSVVGDEAFYVGDACRYVLENDSPRCAELVGLGTPEIDSENELFEQVFGHSPYEVEVHPPLGKWLIGAGIALFDLEPVGWRVAPAVAGAGTIAGLFALARALGLRRVFAALAATLLAFDVMHLAMSRLAYLDVFLTFFGVLAFLFMAMDRRRVVGDNPWHRPWLGAAGAAAGAAIACKWSGILTLVGISILAIMWERPREGDAERTRNRWIVAVSLIAIPLVVYTATFIGRVDGFADLLNAHKDMLSFHSEYQDANNAQSPAWSWPLLKRPITLIIRADGPNFRLISLLGNPVAWWPAMAGVVLAAATAVRRRLPVATIAAVGFGIAYLPWFLAPLTGRQAIFIFYILPALPFIYLAAGWILEKLAAKRVGQICGGVYVAGALGSALFFLPLAIFAPVSEQEAFDRLWFRNCTAPEGRAIEATVDDEVRTITTSEPPPGWCWI
jgi:dolichyl-phosphate-mannose-protein mannosyltransferase